ncbi:hypothetical protein ACIGNX_02040 [Actinosynnema sp. NPDC053489]|uniref:hypothetical protein n=1 Tax=Actinosynnema sp. NPDC053489 TaxID=3363916 RepID=UPI0037C57C3C
MSFVGYLYRGELGDWCAERLTGTKEVANDVLARVRTQPKVRPEGKVERRHWDRAGKTVVARLAGAVQAAPPYSALLGLVRVGLVTRAWADDQATRYPTHARLASPERERALDLRPTPRGWQDLRAAVERGAAIMPATSVEEAERRVQRPGFPDEPVLAELFDRMRAYFWEHAPVGRLGAEGPEKGLVRLCWLLAAFGYAYRNESAGHPLFRLFRDRPPTVRELHAAATDEAIADPLALVRLLQDSGSFDELRALAGNPPLGTPWGVVAPVIFDHWDDTTAVLTGRDGSTLLDVSTVEAFDGDHVRTRLWKLLASAWLDADDAFRIRSAAIYAARHGVLVTWPIDVLEHALLENGNPLDARRALIEIARRLRAEDYARRLEYRANAVPDDHRPRPHDHTRG